MIEWENFRAFLAVARQGSYASATRPLGMVQSTVRRHIESLEARVDAPLFIRGPTGLTLTAAGRDLLPLAEAMEGAAIKAVRAASAPLSGLSGVVRISSFPRLALDVMPGVAVGIRRQYPDIRLELDVATGIESLLRGESDIAVLAGQHTSLGVVGTPCGVAEIGAYAHRDYVARRGMPKTLLEAAEHDLIGSSDRQEMAVASAYLGLNLHRLRFAILCDTPSLQSAMVRSGAGIGLCLAAVADRDPDLIALPLSAFA